MLWSQAYLPLHLVRSALTSEVPLCSRVRRCCLQVRSLFAWLYHSSATTYVIFISPGLPLSSDPQNQVRTAHYFLL